MLKRLQSLLERAAASHDTAQGSAVAEVGQEQDTGKPGNVRTLWSHRGGPPPQAVLAKLQSPLADNQQAQGSVAGSIRMERSHSSSPSVEGELQWRLSEREYTLQAGGAHVTLAPHQGSALIPCNCWGPTPLLKRMIHAGGCGLARFKGRPLEATQHKRATPTTRFQLHLSLWRPTAFRVYKVAPTA